MKFIATNDWHLSLRNPVARVDNYGDELFLLLDQIKRLAIHLQVDGILHAGDVFHENKSPSVQAALMVRTIDYLRDLKNHDIEVYGVPGNHDLRNDRYDTLMEMPLGILIAAGLFTDVSATPIENVVDKYGDKIGIFGLSYPATLEPGAFGRLFDGRADTPRSICIAHCFASPAGGSSFGEKAHAYTELASLPHDVFIFGHDHSDHGVEQINDKYFINIGALCRGASSTDNIKRGIKVALIDIDAKGVKVQQVKLNARPASEIFDLALKEQKDKETSKIEEFVTELKGDIEDSTVGYEDKLAKMELSGEIRTRVKSYLDKAEAQTS